MTRRGPTLRAQIIARDTFLERVAQGLAARVAKLGAALTGISLAQPAREALDELTGFSRELGLIARPDADVTRSDGAAVDVADVIRGVIEAHRDKMPSGARPLRLVVEEGITVACARDDVELVLIELLSNAAKYGAGPIEIRLDAVRSHARLTIRDGGAGIAPAIRRRVLGKFVRGDGARPRTGFGVGLWLVRKVARGYGGDLKLRAGASFEVTLPLAASPALSRRSRPARSGSSRSGRAGASSRRPARR